MHFPLDDDERRMGTEYGRKLRPLMPRPMMTSKDKMMMMMLSPSSSYSYSASSSSCSCSCIRNPNPMPTPMPLVSTRWNPTPEQLQALEDMYRRGVRTPSAEQIQQIASKLRRFGKIEGKNVFYWFQNHKARERQKKRRHLTNNLIHALQSPPGVSSSSSSRRSTCEVQDSASMQAGSVITPDLRQDEWTQLLQHKKKKKKKNINEEQASSSNNQTLHLFPIVASTSLHDAPSTIQTKFTPNQFIEFLPTKN